MPLLRAIADADPWAVIWDLAELPEVRDFPFKVVRAKLEQMVLSGLCQGCVCGCRGDFTITRDGANALAIYDAGVSALDVHAPDTRSSQA